MGQTWNMQVPELYMGYIYHNGESWIWRNKKSRNIWFGYDPSICRESAFWDGPWSKQAPKSHDIPQFGDKPTPIDDLHLPSGYLT